jgi:hypothetical protein
MTKTVKQQRTYERPEIVPSEAVFQIKRMHKLQTHPPKGSLKCTVAIPPHLVPMVQGMASVMQAPSLEAFAVWSMAKGMTCEEVLSRFDDLVNAAL